MLSSSFVFEIFIDLFLFFPVYYAALDIFPPSTYINSNGVLVLSDPTGPLMIKSVTSSLCCFWARKHSYDLNVMKWLRKI